MLEEAEKKEPKNYLEFYSLLKKDIYSLLKEDIKRQNNLLNDLLASQNQIVKMLKEMKKGKKSEKSRPIKK